MFNIKVIIEIIKNCQQKLMRPDLLTKFLRNGDRVNTVVTNTIILGVIW